ncbi:MAG: hypothetical protein P1V36_04500 [Planctomycetota bacterium]|nr:hypothetical protein [Planctomycetota bacterium]
MSVRHLATLLAAALVSLTLWLLLDRDPRAAESPADAGVGETSPPAQQPRLGGRAAGSPVAASPLALEPSEVLHARVRIVGAVRRPTADETLPVGGEVRVIVLRRQVSVQPEPLTVPVTAGRYAVEFTCLPGDQFVLFHSEAEMSRSDIVSRSVEGEAEFSIDLVTQPLAFVHVTVVDRDGRPAAGATFETRPRGQLENAPHADGLGQAQLPLGAFHRLVLVARGVDGTRGRSGLLALQHGKPTRTRIVLDEAWAPVDVVCSSGGDARVTGRAVRFRFGGELTAWIDAFVDGPAVSVELPEVHAHPRAVIELPGLPGQVNLHWPTMDEAIQEGGIELEVGHRASATLRFVSGGGAPLPQLSFTSRLVEAGGAMGKRRYGRSNAQGTAVLAQLPLGTYEVRVANNPPQRVRFAALEEHFDVTVPVASTIRCSLPDASLGVPGGVKLMIQAGEQGAWNREFHSLLRDGMLAVAIPVPDGTAVRVALVTTVEGRVAQTLSSEGRGVSGGEALVLQTRRYSTLIGVAVEDGRLPSGWVQVKRSGDPEADSALAPLRPALGGAVVARLKPGRYTVSYDVRPQFLHPRVLGTIDVTADTRAYSLPFER